ncbi:MAG: phosphotransferase [Myxococcota bacterium]|nr:phosphotransferase [Myxococcota bacterium]
MEFGELPTATQAERIAGLARASLEAWGLSGAEVSLIKYRENAVFAIAAPGERFAMRVHRPGFRSDAAIRSELAWMTALSECGIRTPDVVPTRSGDPIVWAEAPGVPEARQCDLFRWVEGQQLGTLEGGVGGAADAVLGTYRQVGEIAARVHAHGAEWKRPDGFERPAWDADALVGEEPTFGPFWELDQLSDEQRRLLFRTRDRVRERLQAFGAGPDRWGLLHGDLLPENLLVGAGAPRLIDFDDCGEGWYVFELATGLFPIQTQENFDAICRAYVEGYRAVRALPDAQLALLPTLLMARTLSYLGWPVGRPEIHEVREHVGVLVDFACERARRYLAGDPGVTT